MTKQDDSPTLPVRDRPVITTFEMRLAGGAALDALRECQAADAMELAEAAYIAMERVRRRG